MQVAQYVDSALLHPVQNWGRGILATEKVRQNHQLRERNDTPRLLQGSRIFGSLALGLFLQSRRQCPTGKGSKWPRYSD